MAGDVTFACPTCRMPLVQEADRLCCNQCGGRWPLVEGIPHFVSEDQYWGEIDQEEMRKINHQMQSTPWREVLRQHPSAQVQTASVMMMNLDRANWYLFLPLPRESTVLDIGAGSGAITHAMACFYDHVIAIEPVIERVEFMKQRFRQEGLSNVTLVRSHVGKLPILSQSIDLAILNGVLEWIPWSITQGRPREVQLQALQTIHEVLRPGGFVCVGIENRWTLNLLAGAKDPHADIPYVTILPRFLADVYACWKTGQPYRNYLYSAGGYRRLLKQAGFSQVQIYCALPTYNYPKFIIPFDDELFSHFREHFDSHQTGLLRRLVLDALRLVGLDKYLVYSFFVIGRRTNDRDNS